MGLLTREAILSAEDLKQETVSVPEWGGEVLVRGMKGTERDAFEQSLFDGDQYTPENVRARIVARCVCDDKGERVFQDNDIEALGKKSAVALDRVFEVSQRLSGIGKKDLEAAVKK